MTRDEHGAEAADNVLDFKPKMAAAAETTRWTVDQLIGVLQQLPGSAVPTLTLQTAAGEITGTLDAVNNRPVNPLRGRQVGTVELSGPADPEHL
ncbi:hypothetical protein D5S17_28855 [Pseudonocardiaceae bacterium YIM PH 21723]|nr:hypothetical protein D5S17_28855 [Pseudonocardiaceae bacterium YIM PH 21723]